MYSPNSQELRELIQGPGDVEWRYDMRHQCQEILPGLLLGPFQVSKNLVLAQGARHLAHEAFSVRPRFPESFEYLVLDVQDSEEQNLIRLFPRAQQFIDSALSRSGRVLVHCNGGISLSPAFVIMFVMQYYQLSWEDALHLVQNRRYCISPNGGFLTQIKEYESIYKANLAVSTFPTGRQAVSRRKREDDDDEREDKRPLVDDSPSHSHDSDAMES
ncbi:protein-tyrosine phosphatase-like protein [Russula earlei]|uniref:Protein-tyrosine phosphatase-like protein n=1 Tax=Russula earlei TaxID=71964 RepID=A0ACC0UL53_9AGAM|nr:protein-tyrosine phosphatase-like protein [Russula earlei]